MHAIEVASFNAAWAIAAQHFGADCIELCADYRSGGLTPDVGAFLSVMQHVNLPVNVMIRPRPGNFTYNDTEFDQCLKAANWFLNQGAKAVVAGFLMQNNYADIDKMQLLVNEVGAENIVLHRAIDLCTDPLTYLQYVNEVGIPWILTSGQSKKAIDGISTIQQWKKMLNNKTQLRVGGGLTQADILAFHHIDIKNIHISSAAIKKVVHDPKLTLFGFEDQSAELFDFDPEKLLSIRQVVL